MNILKRFIFSGLMILGAVSWVMPVGADELGIAIYSNGVRFDSPNDYRKHRRHIEQLELTRQTQALTARQEQGNASLKQVAQTSQTLEALQTSQITQTSPVAQTSQAKLSNTTSQTCNPFIVDFEPEMLKTVVIGSNEDAEAVNLVQQKMKQVSVEGELERVLEHFNEAPESLKTIKRKQLGLSLKEVAPNPDDPILLVSDQQRLKVMQYENKEQPAGVGEQPAGVGEQLAGVGEQPAGVGEQRATEKKSKVDQREVAQELVANELVRVATSTQESTTAPKMVSPRTANNFLTPLNSRKLASETKQTPKITAENAFTHAINEALATPAKTP